MSHNYSMISKIQATELKKENWLKSELISLILKSLTLILA